MLFSLKPILILKKIQEDWEQSDAITGRNTRNRRAYR